MDKQDIIEYINNNCELDIYHKYLIGQEIWYFQNHGKGDFSSDYDAFKKFISIKLEIPFNNISIVGSAKTKYSFSPSKDFKEFNDKSDFDLIIVSNKLYKNIWLAYRSISLERFLSGYQSKCSNVFNGFVSIKDTDPTYGNNSLEEWQRKVRTFKTELQLKFNIQHDINYRIYSDWESVQDYHVRGISKLKGKINEAN
ncbi:MAG: hypothetical protein OQK69_03360 [Gammaproteobacteria bacterium]|nr:hypothetical protein [Gammaproteobacteria bacterium]